uniref:RNA-directed DNA polymerase, eukaryota n=1 Tax=Tanacetum cinerariifolium TaxID=118510 RepID=A0A699HHJ6_TANCI|nr:RNA-directed DNA polymerase, eukaryota [Tanacetum cinerariifolium]
MRLFPDIIRYQSITNPRRSNRFCLRLISRRLLTRLGSCNGSPTDEFTFHRGLRQGDPLSHFLFITVMESLHVSSQRLIDRDDAMFIGKWTCENVNVLMLMLHCFFLASALKINVQKSSIFGIGVRPSVVRNMAVRYGCIVATLPFTYLGVKVRANMTRISSWDVVINKVTSKISTWKAKSLSVGGRLTLIKSVLGAIPTYYMSLFKAPKGVLKRLESIHNSFFLGADLDERKITWVSWRKAMSQKNHGGLGVHSLYALNHALIFKWIWSFKSAHSGLWLNVIKVIYENEGSLHLSSSNHGCLVWSGIIQAIEKLKTKGIDLYSYCKLVVGNGHSTNIWQDKWYGEVPFKDKFKRCFNLELQKDIYVTLKLHSNDIALSFRRRHRSDGPGPYVVMANSPSNQLERSSTSMCSSLLLLLRDGLRPFVESSNSHLARSFDQGVVVFQP